ncbi:hypothetical protein FY557_05240 [Chryseobacterium sp. SN22]|uniref:hypothetical protein n=1 Tax=Chryseobacterium sp. SN22 TaxID=2606431 RepID=UPI0011ED0423|nr:hypothetical protein [Chryseobacterium sp. SN22]KAA0129305.1 hypothetical protein FY557_05240 [Chryseobacterium sp. SN22]
MRNYDIEIDNTKKYNILMSNEIYDYRDTPFDGLISQYYEFCKDNLDIQSRKIDINPNIIIFNNFFNSNAVAKLMNGVFSISINIGLIKKCSDNFLVNERLDQFIDNKFKEITDRLDNKISGLGFQIATNFTYYHELAHLFQFTKKNEDFKLNEKVENSSDYSLEKHYLEINADAFASIALASHISQYLEKSFGESLNQTIADNVIIILGSCLLNHIANFYSDITAIYFNENSHPHPILRIFNSLLNLTNYLNQSTVLQKQNINIECATMFKKIIDFYREMETNNIFDTNFGGAIDAAEKVEKEIIEYLGQLIEFNLTEYHNALNLWNSQMT